MIKVPYLLLAFLLGAIPTGLLLVRWLRAVDIRTIGSGNIGATNVVRAAGWPLGILTLVLDALKGALVPWLFSQWLPATTQLLIWQIAAGATALAANIFNPFLRFKGGKGVGTAIGVTAVIAPLPMAAGLAGFAIGFALTRIVSVGSLAAGAIFGATAVVIHMSSRPQPPWLWLGFCLAIPLLVFLTHRSNIRRLISGKESRLTRQK